MKTHEVEKIIGVSKQTLYFYENEGLIEVERDNNDYRNYSEDNIKKLTIIKYLRDLDISIDDIRELFADNLTFQDVLKLREEAISLEVEKKTKILKRVASIKEKDLPIFSGIVDEALHEEKHMLGYWKTTGNISMGRPITRELIFRQLTIYSFISVSLAVCFMIGLPKIVGHQISNPFPVFIISILVTFTVIFIFLIGDFIPSGSPYPTSRFNFIEFSESGVRYYQKSGIIQNFKTILKVWFGEDVSTFQKYEDIQSVNVIKKNRFMKPYGYSSMAPAIPVDTADFNFTFKNGESFFLLSPMMIQNDSMWVAQLIREKVSIINDPEDVLETYLDSGKNTNY